MAAAVIVAAGFYFFKDNSSKQTNQNQSADSNANVSTNEAAKYTIDNQESIYFIVNRKRPISTNYIPKDLVTPDINLIPGDNPEEQQLRKEVADAAEQMFNDADKHGYRLVMASGYRSASLQKFYYDNYVRKDGQEAADTYSARPGTSEHQTGLALDIARVDRKCYLQICFASTIEGDWLKNNAHKYGFHLRYQKGKEQITGYQFEPWHFRYVGKELAGKLYESGLAMEEFFGLN